MYFEKLQCWTCVLLSIVTLGKGQNTARVQRVKLPGSNQLEQLIKDFQAQQVEISEMKRQMKRMEQEMKIMKTEGSNDNLNTDICNASGGCEEGWTLTDAGLCLGKLEKLLDFDSGIENCQKFKAALYEVSSKEEQELLNAFLRDVHNITADAWINVGENLESLEFTNWGHGFPNPRGNGSCVFLSQNPLQEKGSFWATAPCTEKKHVVCSKQKILQNPELQAGLESLHGEMLKLVATMRNAVIETECGDGWFETTGDFCLVKLTFRQNWTNAQEGCRSLSGDIFKYTETPDVEGLVDFLGKLGVELEDLWVFEESAAKKDQFTCPYVTVTMLNNAKNEAVANHDPLPQSLCSDEKGVVCQMPKTVTLDVGFKADLDAMLGELLGIARNAGVGQNSTSISE